MTESYTIRSEPQKSAKRHEKVLGRTLIGHQKLLHVKLGSPEIDEQPRCHTRGSQVAKDLRHMLVGDDADGLQFHNQPFLHQEVRVVVTENGAVLVIDFERMLLLDLKPVFPQPIG